MQVISVEEQSRIPGEISCERCTSILVLQHSPQNAKHCTMPLADACCVACHIRVEITIISENCEQNLAVVRSCTQGSSCPWKARGSSGEGNRHGRVCKLPSICNSAIVSNEMWNQESARFRWCMFQRDRVIQQLVSCSYRHLQS